MTRSFPDPRKSLLAQLILSQHFPPIGKLLHAPANWNGPDECRWEG